MELADLERLVAFARARDLVVVHDFAYADIAFDGYRPPSILQVPGADEVAVELVSLSKSHNMAGWRLGFVAGNPAVVAGLARLKSYLDYGVSLAVQRMAVTALEECDDVPGRMAELYQERRDLLCDGLAARGWPVARPRGTMFVWAPIPRAFRAMGSLAFAELLVREAGVAVSPGVGFTAGPDEGRGTWADEHVRFALVQPAERIAAALDRDRDRHGHRSTGRHLRGGTMNRMRVTVGEAGVDLVVTLNDSATAAELWEALPIEGSAQVWGDEVYFTVPVERGPEDPQATVELGAVGYWPPGSALCLFFGQQPVSPVNVVGSIDGDPSGLSAVHEGHAVRLERVAA